MKHITIFASGTGTNAQRIIEYFQNHPQIKVGLVVTNNPSAGVIKIAHQNKIISAIVSKDYFQDEEKMLRLLKAVNTDLIVLAGFLQLVPGFLIKHFPKSIVNIHPALLPLHGGKGMYGENVHRQVLANGDKESGISIHFVNEEYDKGEIILQKTTAIDPNETPETLSEKVRKLEHELLPPTLEKLLLP